jgi:hypothetical protein
MRKIVDRNFLQSPELRAYLAASRKNRAVLADYAAMEAFKGDALANISSATEILREFPKQVVILKSTSIVSQLKGRRCGFTRRMIDKKQTKGFLDWCVTLGQAIAGDQNLQRQLLEAGRDADAHLNRMRNDQESFAENLEEASKRYTDAELKALRTHKPISLDMFDKIFQNVLAMTALLFAANPNTKELPSARELPYTFTFRYALTRYLIALRWIAVGGAKNVKPEKIRNDIVDATLAAYATYFQGLLSRDEKANEIYGDAKAFLNLVLAVPPPPDRAIVKLVANQVS